MSDNTFLLSSPSTVYSLGLDYEQSQHKQEIRDAREAEMTPEELQAAAEQRRMKRVKLGIESPHYKKEESSPSPKWRVTSPNARTAADSSRTPVRTPRASAVKSREETSRAFMHHGPLDSQATSQEAIDALIDARLRDGQQDTVFDPEDVTSQDFLPMLDYRRQPVVYDHDISEEPESACPDSFLVQGNTSLTEVLNPFEEHLLSRGGEEMLGFSSLVAGFVNISEASVQSSVRHVQVASGLLDVDLLAILLLSEKLLAGALDLLLFVVRGSAARWHARRVE
ncbi:hypothetical protein FB451DRAFT_753924 [Mycena latifolia]|nr:hypothetical protein FB451DRAFT_753924 [Mycena latifolia]